MPAQIDTGLPQAVWTQLQDVFAAWPEIHSVILYGSRAKGNYRHASDIDLCLQAPDLTYAQQLQIETQLDDLLLPYQIDLSCWHNLQNPALREHIQRVGQTIYIRYEPQGDT